MVSCNRFGGRSIGTGFGGKGEEGRDRNDWISV